MSRIFIILTILLLLGACTPTAAPSAQIQVPEMRGGSSNASQSFLTADGSRLLTFPQDFGAHEDFRTEWWYYTGNLESADGRHFGFELTIFRVGLLPPAAGLPKDSEWYGRSVYFAHFAISDVASDRFHAFERYARPGPGLAGAQGEPYRVWLENWSIAEQAPGVYRLQAKQEGIALDLNLTDEMGVILHGENGYSRKGKNPTNASYYYSQPRLRADGFVQTESSQIRVSGLAWMDHEFSTLVLDEEQIGWDWFSLQFEDGRAIMLFQLREKDGTISTSSSGTFADAQGNATSIARNDFEITVRDQWQSPHTQAIYPSAWEFQLNAPGCQLQVQPWMSDQEIHFPAVTYWEGAVRFEGTCDGALVHGNGYVELTGYGGRLPLP